MTVNSDDNPAAGAAIDRGSTVISHAAGAACDTTKYWSPMVIIPALVPDDRFGCT